MEHDEEPGYLTRRELWIDAAIGLGIVLVIVVLRALFG